MSKSSEYICISCWASFQAEASASGEVTCPHCGYVQPASDDYLGGSKAEASAPPPPSENDATMADMRAPWTGGEDARESSRSLEPISFDDLEELEALLGDDKPAAKPKPKPKARSRASAARSRGSERAPQAAPPAAPEAPAPAEAQPLAQKAETSAEPAPAAEPAGATTASDAGPEEVLWRLKSDSGLTYSFYDPKALLRWYDGLGPQEHALLSNDTVTWKPVKEFKEHLDAGQSAEEAWESATASRPPPVQAPPSNTTTTTGQREAPTPSGPGRSSTVTRKRPQTTTSERQRPTRRPSGPSVTSERKPAPGRSPSAVGKRGASQVAPVRPTETPEVNPWPGRLAFMALGLVVGGAGVYFGMYLLGFYDLVFHF